MARVGIIMSRKQKRSLEGMADEMGLSVPQVLQTGMALYTIYLREKKAGNDLSIVNSNYDIIKEIVGLDY